VSADLAGAMSPTIFRAKGLRFFFFSLEEARMHVHVLGEEGEAKREGEIREAWNRHFGR
jgi:hypothetical protein